MGDRQRFDEIDYQIRQAKDEIARLQIEGLRAMPSSTPGSTALAWLKAAGMDDEAARRAIAQVVLERRAAKDTAKDGRGEPPCVNGR